LETGARGSGLSTLLSLINVASRSIAAAADLPRKEPPPVATAPIGKYRFLWEVLAGWDWITGYRQKDVVEEMIRLRAD
jgi:hypothetical protein